MKCTLLSEEEELSRGGYGVRSRSQSLGSPSFYRTCTVTPRYLCLEHSGEEREIQFSLGLL